MRSSERGAALFLALFLVAIVATTGAIVASRLDLAARDTRAEDHRLQALWLARSAAVQGKALSRKVTFGDEIASLEVKTEKAPSIHRRVIAIAGFERWGSARVELDHAPDGSVVAHRESFSRPGATPAPPPAPTPAHDAHLDLEP